MFKGLTIVFALLFTLTANANDNPPMIDYTINLVSEDSGTGTFELTIINNLPNPIDCMVVFGDNDPLWDVIIDGNKSSKVYTFNSPKDAPSYGWVCKTE